jgi:carboxymethylenebutenolidase
MGGWFTYRAAKWADRLGVSAAVAFYGGGIAGELGDLRCPTLFLFGGADPHITPEAVERVRDRHPDSEVVVFPGADHGFMRDGSDSFHPDAAADGWRRMLAFFDEHLD